jgi:hypothetical protein
MLPLLKKTVGIRVPARNIRNFTTFSCSSSHYPSARCVSVTKAVCKSTDTFRNLSLNVNNLKVFNFSLFCHCVCLVAVVSYSC